MEFRQSKNTKISLLLKKNWLNSKHSNTLQVAKLILLFLHWYLKQFFISRVWFHNRAYDKFITLLGHIEWFTTCEMFTNQLILKYFNTYENIVVAFLKCVVTRQVDFKNKILHNQKKFFDLFYQINIACNYSMQST